jgi:hypothetical protein
MSPCRSQVAVDLYVAEYIEMHHSIEGICTSCSSRVHGVNYDMPVRVNFNVAVYQVSNLRNGLLPPEERTFVVLATVRFLDGISSVPKTQQSDEPALFPVI